MIRVVRGGERAVLHLFIAITIAVGAPSSAAGIEDPESPLLLHNPTEGLINGGRRPQGVGALSLGTAAWPQGTDSTAPRYGQQSLGMNVGLGYRNVAAQRNSPAYSGTSTSYTSTAPSLSAPPPNAFGNTFFRGWAVITSVDFALLGVCAALPRSFTGWSDHMVADAMDNLKIAYTRAPVWDDDSWAINYIGHPYGGAVYYNTVRCQGASPFESFLFSTALSFQWEYIVEAVAEPPSTQDLLFTSTTGAILGESIHLATVHMKKNGTNIFEKMFILILNPTSVLFTGFK